jgi:acylphosphatase
MVEKTRFHIFVTGRVQRVFFRENMRKEAVLLGITGWVKNLDDGRVEALLEGDEEKVEQIIKWARKGPIMAKVDNLEIIKEEYKGEFPDFYIIH